MNDLCQHCPIRKGCDFLSGLCRLSPREVVAFRPDVIGQTKIDIPARVRAKRALSPEQRERQTLRRRGYFAHRYQANRDEMLAAAKANQAAKKPWRNVDRRQYFKDRYRKGKECTTAE